MNGRFKIRTDFLSFLKKLKALSGMNSRGHGPVRQASLYKPLRDNYLFLR